MSNRIFVVKAIWDDETQVFYSESDIIGLHIEAETLEEFGRIMHENAFDLILANHIQPQELVKKEISELIPTIFWEKQSSGGMVAA